MTKIKSFLRMGPFLILLLFAHTSCSDVTKVKQLVKQGANVNAKDKYGNTALMNAASSFRIETVKALIDRGVDVNAKLMAKTEAVKLLIEKGADVNAKDKYGSTALMNATSYYGNADTVKVLIDAGANVNAKNKGGNTALMNAASFYRFTDTVKVQIDRGVDVNAKLMAKTEAVKLLIEKGADVNAKDKYGNTALMRAVLEEGLLCQIDTVKVLIDAGADVNVKNHFGWTILMRAKDRGHTDIVKVLIDAGADATNCDNALLIRLAEVGATAKVKRLLKQGSDVNAKDEDGNTALIEAATFGNNKTVKALIDAGADVNAKDKYGETALMKAVSSFGDNETVKALIDAGTDVNAKNNFGNTALVLAVKYDHMGIVRLLKQAGAKGQTISEEARRHMIRGQAAVEVAKTPADYEGAIREFEQAAKLAPDWPEIYYNLGVVQQEAGKYGEAIGNLKKYLALAPDATDADAVRDLIYKIEFLKERGWSKEDLVGTWMGPKEVGSLTITLKKPGQSYPSRLSGQKGEYVIMSSDAQYYSNLYLDTAQFDGKRLQIDLKYFRENDVGSFIVRYDSYDLTMVSRGRMTGTIKITRDVPKLDKQGNWVGVSSRQQKTYTGEWLRR